MATMEPPNGLRISRVGITRNVIGNFAQMDGLAVNQPDDHPHPHGKSFQMKGWVQGMELGVDLSI
jgi:hypothetical protein